jgi:hypothetical protein
MDNPQVMDDHEPVGGRMDPASPRFMWGWRRFTATVVRDAIMSSRFLVAFTLRHPRPGQGFKPRLAAKLGSCCAAWLWVFGRGNKGFTFNECCEINGLESCFAIRAVLDILPCSEDIKRVDQWVEEHCRITGCLHPEWGEDA